MDLTKFWTVLFMLTMTVFIASLFNASKSKGKKIENMTERIIPVERQYDNGGGYHNDNEEDRGNGFSDNFGGGMPNPSNPDDMMAMMAMGIMGEMHSDKMNRENRQRYVGVSNFCPHCPNEYDPVCDKDNQITYRNKCMAECNGKYNAVKGTCANAKDSSGDINDDISNYINTATYCHCKDVYDPVVDANGVVYRNICFARTDATSLPPYARGINTKPCTGGTTSTPTSTTLAPTTTSTTRSPTTTSTTRAPTTTSTTRAPTTTSTTTSTTRSPTTTTTTRSPTTTSTTRAPTTTGKAPLK